MNAVDKIHSDLILYTRPSSLKIDPVVKSSTISMISMINDKTTTAEFEAAWKKNPDFKVEMIDCSGGTGLHKAVISNNLEMTKFFIEKLGVEKLNILDCKYITPLRIAGERRIYQRIHNNETTLEIIRQLLEAGADVNLASDFLPLRFDGFDYSLLTQALERSDLELVVLLLKYGARKFVAYSSHDKKHLIKQKLTDQENRIYIQAKNINKTRSPNQKRIDEAKELIKANKEQDLIYENVDLGNTWMIGNYY